MKLFKYKQLAKTLLLISFCTLSNTLPMTSLAQSAKKKTKKVVSDVKQLRFINNYKSLLTKNHPDSALKFWEQNDSTTKKIDRKSRIALLNALALQYDKAKMYNNSLGVYTKIFKNKTEITNTEDLATVNTLINIYAQAGTTDSLSKYVFILDQYYKKGKKTNNASNLQLAKLHYLLGNFDSTKYFIQQYKKKSGNSKLPSSLNLLLSKILYKRGEYELAIKEVQKNIALATTAGDLNEKIKYELLEIDVLTDLGKEKISFDKSKKLYQLHQNNSKIRDDLRGLVKYNYAKQLYNNGKFQETIETNNEAIALLKSCMIEKNSYHGNALLLTAMVYTDLTDFGAAELYLSEAASIFNTAPGPDHTEYDEYSFSKSYYWYSMEAYDKALTEGFNALSIRKRIYGVNNVKTASAYNIIGNIYEKTGKASDSRLYLDSAMVVFHKFILDKDHSLYGKLHNDIGLVEQRKELIPTAISAYVESLRIYEKIYGILHPDLSIGYMNTASLYKETNEHKKAFYYIQKSLMANCIKYEDTSIFSNPIQNIALSDFILLKTTILKCRALQSWADSLEKSNQSTEAMKYYKASIENYFFALKIIHRLRNSYVSEDSKIYLTEKTAFIFEEGIRICRMIYSKTNDNSFLEKAFAFSEKSKAGMLLSAIQESNAKKIAGLPDSLLAKEKSLIATINQIDKDLFKELKKGRKADPEKIEYYKETLFKNKQELISYLTYIEKNYNKYFKLKYDDNIITISQVQETLLTNDKDVMLEYFVGKDSIYIFHITNSSFNIYTSVKDSMFTRFIYGLRNSIKYNIGEVFALSAMELYKPIFQPVEKLIKNKNVIVVPDVLFTGTSLQVLFSNKKSEKNIKAATKGNYKKLPYILNTCTLTYEISAAVAIQNNKKLETGELPNAKHRHKLFVMAPVFDVNRKGGTILESQSKELPPLELDTTNLGNSVIPKHVKKLPGTEKEVEELIELFKRKKAPARAYLYNYAQKNLLSTKTLKNYNYIHFATHGELDLSDARFSGLHLLDRDSDTLEGVYSLGNVYSLDLTAKLVSLSACETGLGKVVSGEGVMGFTRAFTYAGAQSIVVSLWKVNDDATTDLMKNFYKHLFDKKSRGHALMKAQSKLSKNKKTQPPFYWAAFIIYGK